MNKNNRISVVVFANRKDFFFTKICIASIRYYYPDIEIFLVKDQLNGNFRTRKLRNVYNVKLLHLSKKYFGWSAAKLHFLLNKNIEAKRYLCLDSDIIFVGRVMEKLEEVEAQFIFNPHYLDPPFSDYMKQIFLDPHEIQRVFADYEYPGYFFNAGQTVVVPGLITPDLLSSCFDCERYPYYKNQDIFRTVDQSILNAVIPVLKNRKKIEVAELEYMKLSIDFFSGEVNNDFDKIKEGKNAFMVHYAGEFRDRNLSKMRGEQILGGFRNLYYTNLSNFERWLDKVQDIYNSNKLISFLLLKSNRLWIEIVNRIAK